MSAGLSIGVLVSVFVPVGVTLWFSLWDETPGHRDGAGQQGGRGTGP